MRVITFLITIFSTFFFYGQSKEIEFLQTFFKENSPCGMPTYCYDYEFQIEDDVIIISTKLYNGSVRELTETTHYRIPVNGIKNMSFFPGGSRDIFIVMKGETIKKNTNDAVEMMSYLPFDFNLQKLTAESRQAFRRNFESLINKLSD